MRKPTESDRELAERTRNGDDNAFRALVEKHQQGAFAVALGIVHDRDDALDICQEAFVRAYRGMAGFDGRSQFFTWLYRIVHNLAIDHLRKRRVQTVHLGDAERNLAADECISFNPARNLGNEQLRERLTQALEKLSPSHRSVLLMREVQGLSYKQIAEATGCAIGTVMSRLFHARRNLQRELLPDLEAFDLAA
jgi:RNA polymerase sigma-70 factor (ECF subfamily)